ncbi:FAD-dependent monooxygenase [Kitasatospora sp. NPDC097605]|uniref:NAD(P)/FAD-dependent oxidoreductase n=1 Tax=Kitasatospora sp. NPDC097605 TaxID=3157226 RepID=UPI003326B93E
MASSERPPVRDTAVVIGGGLAGMTAAWALRGYAERIVVVERDRYPAAAVQRAGLPQGHHAHLVLEAGQRLLEEMMPGITRELMAAGARRVNASEVRWLSSAGWMAEFPARMSLLCCTRPVLDASVLKRVRTAAPIEFVEGADVVGLLGSPQAVTGARVRERRTAHGAVRDLPAGLVVDASGRSTSVPRWLAALGCPPVPHEQVDVGVTYASRMFRRPADTPLGSHLAVYLQTKAPDDPRMGALLPVEGDRWIVSLAGMRGAEPEPGERGFTEHLHQLRDPILSEALRNAEPLSRVRGFRPGPSVRRHYERGCPDGLVAVGDAVNAFNPVYAQGITVALLCAEVLRRSALRHGGIGAAMGRDARNGIARVSRTPWVMASAEDARFAATTGAPSGALLKAQHRFLDLVLAAATRDPVVTAAFQEVMSMVSPPSTLLRPSVLAAVLRSRLSGGLAGS